MAKQPYTAAETMPKDETLRLLLSSEEGRRIDEHLRYCAFACRASIVMFGVGLVLLVTIILSKSPPQDFGINTLREFSAIPVMLFFSAVVLMCVSPFVYLQNKFSLKQARKRQENFLAFMRRYKRI